MSWKVTIRYFIVPALALVITFKLYTFINGYLVKNYYNKSQHQSTGEALIGGSFSLTNQDGTTVTDVDLKGKFVLVYFGFSHCPDICPTDLALISQVMEQLGDTAQKIQPVFITVDPERDTPEELKTYLTNFYPGIIGLTGSKEQISDIANKYRIYAKKVESESIGEYLMDHSAFTYLMDKDGKYVTHFSGNQTAEEIIAKINTLL